MKAAPVLALLALLGTAAGEPARAVDAPASWNFVVRLDGTPIGTHAFRLVGQGEQRELHSDARFAVKLLGLTVYRYRHHAVEQWQGDCLAGLDASTDDNGKTVAVKGSRNGDGLTLNTPDGAREVPGCLMSFAYWNPQMLQQTRLLNPQTGKLEAVRLRDLGESALPGANGGVAARHWRIDGASQPIELWYSAKGEWVGLESLVDGRKLTYRLE